MHNDDSEFFMAAAIMTLVAVVVNLALLAGAAYVVVWVLQSTGVL